jgi:phenol 2-monooxygenase
MRCAIHSASNGSLMVIPRESKLVRLYIQLKEVTPDASGRADRSKITPELIFGAAKKILSPYKLDYEYCDWWTAYQIGQRIAPEFEKHRRVFLAGDASTNSHSFWRRFRCCTPRPETQPFLSQTLQGNH